VVVLNGTEAFFYAIVEHEIIHSLGFFGHTGDGGLMDAVITNDFLTAIVQETVPVIYTLPPNTEVLPDP